MKFLSCTEGRSLKRTLSGSLFGSESDSLESSEERKNSKRPKLMAQSPKPQLGNLVSINFSQSISDNKSYPNQMVAIRSTVDRKTTEPAPTWLLQSNPKGAKKGFNINEYLQLHRKILWHVPQQEIKKYILNRMIKRDDPIFVWRSAGDWDEKLSKDKDKQPGIMAKGYILSTNKDYKHYHQLIKEEEKFWRVEYTLILFANNIRMPPKMKDIKLPVKNDQGEIIAFKKASSNCIGLQYIKETQSIQICFWEESSLYKKEYRYDQLSIDPLSINKKNSIAKLQQVLFSENPLDPSRGQKVYLMENKFPPPEEELRNQLIASKNKYNAILINQRKKTYYYTLKTGGWVQKGPFPVTEEDRRHINSLRFPTVDQNFEIIEPRYGNVLTKIIAKKCGLIRENIEGGVEVIITEFIDPKNILEKAKIIKEWKEGKPHNLWDGNSVLMKSVFPTAVPEATEFLRLWNEHLRQNEKFLIKPPLSDDDDGETKESKSSSDTQPGVEEDKGSDQKNQARRASRFERPARSELVEYVGFKPSLKFSNPEENYREIYLNMEKKDFPTQLNSNQSKPPLGKLTDEARRAMGRWGEYCVYLGLKWYYEKRYDAESAETANGFIVMGIYKNEVRIVEVTWPNKMYVDKPETDAKKSVDLTIIKEKWVKSEDRETELTEQLSILTGRQDDILRKIIGQNRQHKKLDDEFERVLKTIREVETKREEFKNKPSGYQVIKRTNYCEIKTTRGTEECPRRVDFSENQLREMRTHANRYSIFRLFDAESTPKGVRYKNPYPKIVSGELVPKSMRFDI